MMGRLAGVMATMLLACAACTRGDAAAPSDLAVSTLAGPVASLATEQLVLPPESAQLGALQQDMQGWNPVPGRPGVTRSSTEVVFDALGWMQEARFGWEGDQGWRIRMVFGDGAGRSSSGPVPVKVWLQPPQAAGAPDLPMGEGDVRYAGSKRVLQYRGQRPHVEGTERFERRQQLGRDGWVELEESTNVLPDGTVIRGRRQSLVRDAQGRAVEEAEQLDGVDYRVDNHYFLPDVQGNPRRVVRLYRAAGAAHDAPVLRAEVTLRTLRYQDETR